MKIKDILRDKPVDGRFMITESQYKTAKNGKHFINLKIADSTGEIYMKIWDANEELFDLLTPGRVVELSGAVAREFNQQLQIELDSRQIENLRLCSEEEADFSEFLPVAIQDRHELWDKLQKTINSIENPFLKSLLAGFYEDRDFLGRFLKVPAALKRHHVYIGGLLEHTYGVAALCTAAAAIYPGIDRELLLTGALLHDIGKVRSYEISKGFTGTDEGKLIGHLVIGVRMVEEKIAGLAEKKVPFPEDLKLKLLHLLISHHGIMEWGSPVEPLFIEASLLHHADNMDAQAAKFLAATRNHDPLAGKWTGYDPSLGRSVYVGEALFEAQSAASEE